MISPFELPVDYCLRCNHSYDSKRKPHLCKCGLHYCTNCVSELGENFRSVCCYLCKRSFVLPHDNFNGCSINITKISQIVRDIHKYKMDKNDFLCRQIEFKQICPTHKKEAKFIDMSLGSLCVLIALKGTKITPSP